MVSIGTGVKIMCTKCGILNLRHRTEEFIVCGKLLQCVYACVFGLHQGALKTLAKYQADKYSAHFIKSAKNHHSECAIGVPFFSPCLITLTQ